MNLRSHAHGQGYADLHFLIPETVKAVDAHKGPYFVEFGDFDTAGAVNFVTLDVVEENTLEVAGGSFDTQRYLALVSPPKDQIKTLLAVEGYLSDGPFDAPQRLCALQRVRQGHHHPGRGHEALAVRRRTITPSGTARARSPRAPSARVSSTASAPSIPTRAASPSAPTSTSSQLEDHRAQRLAAQAYVTYYELSLFNNFTFFLNDPVNGDMINQRDTRVLAGFNAEYEVDSKPLGIPLTSTAGFQYRIDTPHVVLANAVQRSSSAAPRTSTSSSSRSRPS